MIFESDNDDEFEIEFTPDDDGASLFSDVTMPIGGLACLDCGGHLDGLRCWDCGKYWINPNLFPDEMQA